MNNFKKGDLVQLRSGGPKMTVESEDLMTDKLNCQWFVGNSINQEWFPKESLIKLSDSESHISSYSGIIFNKMRRTLTYGGQIVYLTPHEAKTIDLFLNRPYIVVSHEEIVMHIQRRSTVHKNPAEITRPLISRLLDKLKTIPGAENWIQSIRGTGYIFIKE